MNQTEQKTTVSEAVRKHKEFLAAFLFEQFGAEQMK